MSETNSLDELPNVDRLTKWRNERLEKAEADKRERLRIKSLERQTQEERKKLMKLQAAKALLPTQAEQAEQERILLKADERTLTRGLATFALCVLLPIAASVYYHVAVATPMFSASTVVTVSKPSSASQVQPVGYLNSVTPPPNIKEAFIADAFINSGTMMQQLEDSNGLISRWSSEDIDGLQRLRTVEALGISQAALLHDFVQSRVDVQTGLLTIEVRDPDQSIALAAIEQILTQTEMHLNVLAGRAVADQIGRAEAEVEAARTELLAAQELLSSVQLRSGEVDPRLSIANVYDSIRRLESEAMILEAEVAKAQIAGRGESYLAGQTRELAALTRSEIAERRAILLEGSAGQPSLNTILLDHERATLQVKLAEQALATALENLAATQKAAAESRFAMQIAVPPNATTFAANTNAIPSIMVVALLSLSLFAFMSLIRTARGGGLP